MHRLVAIFSAILFSAVGVLAQGTPETLQVGYAVVTPSSPITTGMTVFETITQTRSQDTLQVSVFPPNLTMNALLTVEVSNSLSKTLGVAIANPNSATANLTMTLRRSDGTQLTATTITIVGRRQISKLVTELFPAPLSGGFSTQVSIPSEFTGTLVINSTSPVSIVGLKFRGPNYTTIPVTDLSPANTPIPTISSGVEGLGAVLFPQFVAGAGWATEIAVVNTTASSLTVRLDVFTQDGAPLTVTLNGQTFSSFTNLVIPSNGLLTIVP
jgi:hypothetical protein